MAKKRPTKKSKEPDSIVKRSLKNLKPIRITKQLRDSARRPADFSARSKSVKRDHANDRKEARESLENCFSETFRDYLKFLSADNLVFTAATVEARKEVIGRILHYHYDTETVIAFLADMWNLKIKTVIEYARQYFENYKQGLPYDRVMAARRAVKEYNDIIEYGVRSGDLNAARAALVERNKLMGLVEADFWADELEGHDESVQIYLPDNQRDKR